MTVESTGDAHDGVRVLRATGELDLLGVAPALEQVPELVRGARGVVLDLSDVSFFDSSCVRLADALSRACSAAGAAFRLVAPPGSRCRRVLDIVGMSEQLAEDDLESALAAVKA